MHTGEICTSVSIKGVCLHGAQVLLARNDRGQWELPGGRPETGEAFARCVERELREETGLTVRCRERLCAYSFEVLKGRWVEIVAYRCELIGPFTEPRVSHEHSEVRFLDPSAIDGAELPAGYRAAIAEALRSRPAGQRARRAR